MKKNFYSLIVLIFLFALGVSMFGQEKTAKPLMKITVKDGKVVSAVPLDNSSNTDIASDTPYAEDNLTIISNGLEQNSQVSAPVRPDTILSPDRAAIQAKPQDPEMVVGTLEVSPGDPAEPGANPDEFFIKNDVIPKEAQEKVKKGQFLEAEIEPTSAVFDPETANVRYLQNDSRDVKENYVAQEADIRPEAAWELIYANDWEPAGPYDWNIYTGSGAADAYWIDNTYRASNGIWSLFCAGAGTAGVTPPANYPNDMDAWAVYGPFDLSDATMAEVDFELWLDAETNYDYFRYMVSVDGVNFEGWSATGTTSGWWSYVFDLTTVPVLGDVTGNDEVYFALQFESDYIVGREGAFVDEIEIWKYAQDVDLIATNLTHTPDPWNPGQSVTADLTELNTGTDPAQAHYSRLYLSENSTITTSDIQLGGDLYFGSIAAGGNQTVSETFTVPAVPDGFYYVGTILDIYNDCHETIESNTYYLSTMVEVITPTIDIDLYWTSLVVTTDLWSGGLSVTATLTEVNGGTGPAGGHYSRLYLSDNSTISTGDTQLGGDLYFSSIAAGGSQAVAESFSAPAMPSGTYYMGAIVDIYDDVAESDESNNINYRMGMINYDPDIDLYSTSIGLSTSAWVVGSPVTADLTEVNNGLDAAGAHYSRLYLSIDNTITTGDVQLGGDLYFSSIASGGSQTVGGHTFNVPNVAVGTYYVGNIVDIYDDVLETNEANNYAVRAGLVDIILPTFTINATVQPAGSGTVSGTGVYDLNQSASLLATPATGYEFVNWTESGSVVSTDESYVFTVTSDRNLVANFQLITLQVTTEVNPVEGGTAGGGGSYPYGSSVTLLAVPATGYEFVNWTESGSVVSTDESYVFTVTSDRNLVANFQLITLQVTTEVNPVEGGTAGGGGSYPYGSSVTLVATPATGYEFVNWTESGSEVSTQESYVITVTSDRNLVANFQLITLLVTTETNPVEGGTTSGGGSYPYGSSVTLLAVPSADYDFVNWTIADVEVATTLTYTFTVTENTVVRANFALMTLTVTVVADPVEGGTVTGGGEYLLGETAVLAAAPADGYAFYHWTNESNEVVSAENPYSFTVVENISLKGIFGNPNGIGESEMQNIGLYPNPVGDYLYVEFKVELSEAAVISLYDVSGKVLANYKGSHLFNDVLELKTSHLNPGIYFIKITDIDTGTRFTGKVIKR